jgi:hypothetical protein
LVEQIKGSNQRHIICCWLIMLSTHDIKLGTCLGRLSLFMPLLAMCSACSSSADPTTPLFGSGNPPSAGSSGAATGGGAGGTTATGGSFGTPFTGGTFGVPGTGGTLVFGNAGTDSSGTGGGFSAAGTGVSAGGTAGNETGGAAGSAPIGCGKSTGVEPLIDDFEDGDMALKMVDGRNGPWETFDDGSIGGVYGSRTPVAATGHGGTTGFCTTLSGYKAWGANVVASMSSPKCGYDASSYDGVCFWAKGKVTAGGPFVFAVGTSDTVPDTSGGACTQQGRCNSHYEANPALQDADYKQYCYKWTELKSPNIPMPPAFNKATIVQIEWKFPASNAKSTEGSFCIDDISFCKGDACTAK